MNINIPSIEEGFHAEGYVTIGGRYASEALTGIWLRVGSDTQLALVMHDKGIKHVRFVHDPKNRRFFIVPTFDHRRNDVYRLQRKEGGSLYIEAPLRYFPEAFIDLVHSKEPNQSRSCEVYLLPEGALFMGDGSDLSDADIRR